MKNNDIMDGAYMAKITVLGDMRVLLDCDVAEFMETSTVDILEAVKQNVFRFDSKDLLMMRDSRWQKKLMETDRFAKVPKSRLPVFAFTANGMITLATVLRSDHAHVICRMLVRTYSSVVDLRYFLHCMSMVDDEAAQEKLMQECGRIINELFCIQEPDGSASVAFKVQKRFANQPVASEGFFKMAEENVRLQHELDQARQQLHELQSGIFRNKGVS